MFTVSSVIAFEGAMSKGKDNHFEPVYNFCELFLLQEVLTTVFSVASNSVGKKIMCISRFRLCEVVIGFAGLELPSTYFLRTCSLHVLHGMSFAFYDAGRIISSKNTAYFKAVLV